MKKTLCLFLCLLLCLPLVSCASAQEKEVRKTVEAYFAATSSFDSERETALLSLTAQEKDWYFHGLDDAEFEAYEGMTALSESFGVLFCEIVGRTEYKIKKIVPSSDGTGAEVQVSVSYVDGEALFAAVLSDVQRELIGQSLNEKNLSFGETLEIAVAAMIRDRNYSVVTQEIQLELVSENGTWKILPNEAAKLISNCHFCRDSETILSLLEQIG